MEITFSKLLAVLFVLMVLQVVGTHMQVKAYRRAVHRLHALGNLGIGSARRFLGAGSIVIIACDRNGVITGGEIMQGMTVFCTFHALEEIKGRHIGELKNHYLGLPKKRRSCYKGHIQALEALELRLRGGKEEMRQAAITADSIGETA